MSLAIVTGGSRGIGAAIAEKLAQDGFDVLINCASSVEKAEAVAEKCRAHGVNAYVKKWDVADYDACSTALKEIKEEIGVPFVLVNNAGINLREPVTDMDDALWQKMLDTNLTSVFRVSRAAFPMLKEKGGKVDYIHGAEVIRELSAKENSIGFMLPDMGKEELFPTVIVDGALPRKTFSMGHAEDKRFYVEARKILK